MNHSNHKIVLKLMLPLFILLAGCSFPTDGKTQVTPTPSSTPTLLPTVTSTPTPTENVGLMPTQVTPTNSSNDEQATESPLNPGENQVTTPAVDGFAQQPSATAIEPTFVPDHSEPQYTELTPAPVVPAQPNPIDSERQPNADQSGEHTANPAENHDATSAVDGAAQEPSPDVTVIEPSIILDPGEPNTKATPTPCVFCTAE